MFGVLVLIVIIVVSSLGAIKYHYSVKEKKAIQLAQNYLAQKYTQEMRFLNVRLPLTLDGAYYHVYFSPINNPDLIFEVGVWPNLTLLISTDDYYLRFVSLNIEKAFQNDVHKVWDVSADIYIYANYSIRYSYEIPIELNEQMDAVEIAPFLDYEFGIDTNRSLENDSKGEEAQKMFELIQIVQASNYTPTEIYFRYQTEGIKEGTNVKKSIQFENWAQISSIEEIEKIMDEQWFNK